MKTTIDNTQRVFVIQKIGQSRTFFCNLKDIPKCIKQLEKNDEFKIYHYWNFELKRISKKYINEMFKANKIDFKLK